ncbi:hypothetical protein [Dictyobacter formicarum]|nr:hypothetical protein [Dictyobacter formicarum]
MHNARLFTSGFALFPGVLRLAGMAFAWSPNVYALAASCTPVRLHASR